MMIKAKDAECYEGLATAERRFIENAHHECDVAARSLELTYKTTLRMIQERRIANTVQSPYHVRVDDYQTQMRT